MTVRFGFVRLRLALHLQAVFLELLRVERLLRTVLPGLLVGPAFATLGTIAPVAAAAATAAAIASAAARLAAFLLGLTVAVLRSRVGCLRRPLLLRRTRWALIGATLTLWALGGLLRGLR